MRKQQRPVLIPHEIPHTLLTYIAPWRYHRQTKMEINDDVGKQTCRQTRMETYEYEDRCTLGLSKAAALLLLTTTPEWRRLRQTKKKTDALWG